MLLYQTLLKFGLAEGDYRAEPDDGMTLTGCRIVNAVRCVPPANLPEPKEVRTCNRFLAAELQACRTLRAVLALGVLAHAAVLQACGIPPTRIRFRHGEMHALPDGLLLANSYHVSRYNTNTAVLTPAMFELVIAGITNVLARPDAAGKPGARGSYLTALALLRISRALSRCQSRAAIAWRLSALLRPSADPEQHLGAGRGR